MNRPDGSNAIDILLARALIEGAIACDENPAVGRFFCAGGDIAAFGQATTAEGREGIAAFLAKRKPDFPGVAGRSESSR